jgi:hypothetical protein
LMAAEQKGKATARLSLERMNRLALREKHT